MRLQTALPFDIVHTACCLLFAAGLALVVRPTTAGLTHSVGTVWPFSLAHCSSPAIPGCELRREVHARVFVGRIGVSIR